MEQRVFLLEDVAELAGLSERTVRELVREGRGPRVAFRDGRSLVFLAGDVASWALERRRAACR